MSFDRLLHPKCLAVFGGAEAEQVIHQCDRMAFAGEIWPVHPKRNVMAGRKVFRSVADLPGSPDAAYLAVNRHLTIQLARELASIGAGGAVCFATGFKESGTEGERLESSLLAAAGEMPLLGPNCYGLLNYLEGAMLWPDQQGGRRVDRGVALVTMSSNVAFNLTMQRRGLPISYVVSLGNRLRFDLHDAIEIFAADARVSAIGLYLEGIDDPVAFEAAALRAREMCKPIVVIKTGRSAKARQIAMTHAATLAGTDDLMSAFFERLGVARVDSLETLVEALKVLHVVGPLEGGRLGVMSTSGGDLALVADAVSGTGLELPELSEDGRTRLHEVVHERVVAGNPLDYQMFDWNDEIRLSRTFSCFLSEGFDFSLCLLDPPRADLCDASSWSGAERAFLAACRDLEAHGAILATFSDNLPEALARRWIEDGVVPLAGIDSGIGGLRAAYEIGKAWQRAPGADLLRAPRSAVSSEGELLDEADSKKILTKRGIRVPDGFVVEQMADALDAANTIGYPVVAKALGIAHKTELRAVHLGLTCPEELIRALEGMAHLGKRFLIEKAIDGAVAELMIGVASDEIFGPYLIIGAGGIWVEILKDCKSLLLPVDRVQVEDALEALQCSAWFRGSRGRAKADREAAVGAILAIGDFVVEHLDSVIELDVNPLLVLEEGRGAVAVDALIRLNQPVKT